MTSVCGKVGIKDPNFRSFERRLFVEVPRARITRVEEAHRKHEKVERDENY